MVVEPSPPSPETTRESGDTKDLLSDTSSESSGSCVSSLRRNHIRRGKEREQTGRSTVEGYEIGREVGRKSFVKWGLSEGGTRIRTTRASEYHPESP